jgi:hypothetical protein
VSGLCIMSYNVMHRLWHSGIESHIKVVQTAASAASTCGRSAVHTLGSGLLAFYALSGQVTLVEHHYVSSTRLREVSSMCIVTHLL